MRAHHKNIGDKPMTQLIGVICEDRRKIILLSDRMVTTANGSLAFEHEAKSAMVSVNAMVLSAGTIHEPELIENAQKEIKERPKILNIAQALSKHYREVRKQRITSDLLEEIGFSSIDEFHKKQKILHENMVIDISDRIRKFSLELYLVLGGVDEYAHLYRIEEPGTYRSFDSLGFLCVGSGDRHADPVFAFYGYSPKLKTPEALKIAFEAKKRAEMAGGVGRQTDIWIIDKKGIGKITTETIKKLEESHAKQEDYSRLLTSVEPKTKKLEFEKTQT